VNKDTNTLWKIDKILRKKKVKGQTEVLVSWQNWPSKFDSWVKESDIQKV